MSSTLKPAGTLNRLTGVALFSPTTGPTATGRDGNSGFSDGATFAVKSAAGCTVSAAAFALAFPPLPFLAALGSGVDVSAANAAVVASSATARQVRERTVD